jgi:tetraacyldisaccharide 4'-kinase
MAVLAGGYLGLLRTREWLYRRRILASRALPCGVVSIGNLTLGGTGKTPAVILTVETLRQLGACPAVVSRGYGRRSHGLRVVADGQAIRADAGEAGDEPVLLARRLPGTPVLVAESRYDAARYAVTRLGATTIVLDDGLQHRSLVKHLEIVLARAESPWGNGRLFPAGPLREPLTALERATLIVATGADGSRPLTEIEAARDRWAPGIPIVRSTHEPDGILEAGRDGVTPATGLAGRRLVGFAGIAYPEAFRRTLGTLGVDIVDFVGFPDHHRYRGADLADLERRVRATRAEGLVTTEKDWVRLGSWADRSVPLRVLRVRLALSADEDVWRDTLRRIVQ